MTKVVLYHYTTQEGLLGIIRSKTVWASNVHYLNDSKEFRHAIELANRLAWSSANESKEDWRLEFRDRLKQGLEQISRIHIFVFSLSENGDQLSQWRGYCPAGAGYSLGFEIEKLRSISARQGFALEPVVYDPQEQEQLLGALIERLTRAHFSDKEIHLSKEKIENAVNYFLSEFVRLAPKLKDQSFREEREWRLISGLVSVDDPRLDFRPGKSGIIPYVKIRLEAADIDFPIKEVVVGPTQDMELATGAVSTFMSSQKIKNWRVRCSQVPYRNW